MSWEQSQPHHPQLLSEAETWSKMMSSSPFVQGLLAGSKWGVRDPDTGVAVSLQYYRASDEPLPADSGLAQPWSQPEIRASSQAMRAYAVVANITFKKTRKLAEANIIWAPLNDADSEGNLGWAYTPDAPDFWGYSPEVAGLTTFNRDAIRGKSLAPGSYDYLTFPHELGHALGLKHPHDEMNYYSSFPGVESWLDDGDSNLNGGPWTVMTYNDQSARNGFSPIGTSDRGFLMTLGAFDIAAVQYLYGANPRTGSRNDVYSLASDRLQGIACLWDTGGVDAISGAHASAYVSIDLRNATLLDSPGGAGFVSKQNNGMIAGYTIAFNPEGGQCIIENAIGSVFADSLTGNQANNILDGRGGGDRMEGLGGDDLYCVDNAADQVIEEMGRFGGVDTVQSSISWRLSDDDVENLELIGGRRTKGIGNDLPNVLTGNRSANVLTGLRGSDLYYVQNSDDQVNEENGVSGGIDEVRSTVSYSLAGTAVENLTLLGSEAIDGKGNNAANILIGNAAMNRLAGRGGDDIYHIQNRSDVVDESDGAEAGIDEVVSSVGYFLADVDVENLTLIGMASLNGTGNDADNAITGNRGHNLLIGGRGSDHLYGLEGRDVLVGPNADGFFGRSPGRDSIDTLTGDMVRGRSYLDTFVLGDLSQGVYYDHGNPRNPGHEDYALIKDFHGSDLIQLIGDPADYILRKTVLDGQTGTGLYLNDGTGSGASRSGWDLNDELIALVIVSGSRLNLANPDQFLFLD